MFWNKGMNKMKVSILFRYSEEGHSRKPVTAGTNALREEHCCVRTTTRLVKDVGE